MLDQNVLRYGCTLLDDMHKIYSRCRLFSEVGSLPKANFIFKIFEQILNFHSMLLCTTCDMLEFASSSVALVDCGHGSVCPTSLVTNTSLGYRNIYMHSVPSEARS